MTNKLKQDLIAAAYTMPGICKVGHEMIDLEAVLVLIDKHWPVAPITDDTDITPVVQDNDYF